MDDEEELSSLLEEDELSRSQVEVRSAEDEISKVRLIIQLHIVACSVFVLTHP